MWRRLFNPWRRLTDRRIIDAAIVLARALSEGDNEEVQIQALQNAGFEVGEAHRFVAFLPLAFSRPVLEELGARISPTISVPTEDGRDLEVMLDRQPEYVAGLSLARRHRRSSCVPNWAYVAITESSADIDAISIALNAGADVEGAVVASAIVATWHGRYVVT